MNLASKADAEKFTKDKKLSGAAAHAVVLGSTPAAFGIKYIPHKTLVDKDGVVIKNGFKDALPGLLAGVLDGKTD